MGKRSPGPSNCGMTKPLKFEVCAALFVSALWAGSLTADWQPYQARYDVYRNGKLAGEAEVSLAVEGSRWTMTSNGHGTHGFARFLRASDTEKADGRLVDGKMLPSQYTRQTRVAGVEDWMSARFDWRANQVVVSTEDASAGPGLRLDLGKGALDPLSLKLELRRRLRDDDGELSFLLVDEDEIKPQTYRRLAPERLETSLGCISTLPVERVRTGSKRFTRGWHAPDLDYVTVRMEHGKTDGDRMEMRIKSLMLDGKQVQAKAACARM